MSSECEFCLKILRKQYQTCFIHGPVSSDHHNSLSVEHRTMQVSTAVGGEWFGSDTDTNWGWRQVCAAAADGDVRKLRLLHDFGVSMQKGDYDDRYTSRCLSLVSCGPSPSCCVVRRGPGRGARPCTCALQVAERVADRSALSRPLPARVTSRHCYGVEA